MNDKTGNDTMEARKSWSEKYFPPRQVFFKTQNDVRYFTFSPFIQKLSATTLALAFVWVAYATINTVFRTEILDAKDEEIAALKEESEAKSQTMEALEGKIIQKTEELEARQDYLNSLIETDPTGTLAPVNLDEIEEAEVEPAQESSAKPVGGFFFSSAYAAVDPKLSGAAFLEAIEARLEQVEEKQNRVAQHLAKIADDRLTEYDFMLAPFKITASDLARATPFHLGTSAQGGPYVDEGVRTINLDEEAYFPELEAKWDEYLRASAGFQNLPLYEPVKDFYLSSRFGKRIDPFTKKRGWHPGIDLAGWPGTKIYATTAGTVTKAGTWSTYGQMVEIDHGNGFKTRYAHMRKVLVKRGVTVKPGDVLGEMGCTGRCASTHLHYEVFFNDVLRNPQPFMEAPEDVQQTQKQTNTNPDPKPNL